MPLMDEFKQERESIKNQPFKKKAEYFWTYYKWWVFGAIGLIIIGAVVITNIVNHKEEIVYVAMIDTAENPTGDIEHSITVPFLTANGYDPKKNTVNFNTNFMFSQAGLGSGADSSSGAPSYSSTQGFSGRESLAVYISAGDVDAICGCDEWFDIYAYSDFFLDLRKVMNEDTLSRYEDHLYYVDRAVLERYEEAKKNDNYDYNEPLPDPLNPAAMAEPVPIGITLEDKDYYNYNFINANVNSKHIIFGIVRNTKSFEITSKLLEFIMNDGSV